jgi:hypothetical protein
MDISYISDCRHQDIRLRLYRGELMILPPHPASLALAGFARELIEAAFAPHHPQHAHDALEVADAVRILTRLKPEIIQHPRTNDLLKRVLLDFGCDADRTYQDVPRLRVAYPAHYLTTGIAYAHHPHRDTWYSAPPCQLNWWMPLYEFDASQGMAFHPQYWDRQIKNGSDAFNYYRWNADGRKNAAQHVKSDTRVQPHALEPLDLEPAIRLVVPVGGVILFSGAQLHSTVRNDTPVARWSIDFRTVDLDDLVERRGAPTDDSACTGTSLRDFRRVRDLELLPDKVIALYDDAPVGEDTLAVYTPAAALAHDSSRPAK